MKIQYLSFCIYVLGTFLDYEKSCNKAAEYSWQDSESNGVKIVLDENMDALLSGAGFVINNQNAGASGCDATCGGCG